MSYKNNNNNCKKSSSSSSNTEYLKKQQKPTNVAITSLRSQWLAENERDRERGKEKAIRAG